MRTFLAAPKASTLIESMRDIGYSLDTALADIIDNAITAGASEVDIIADTTSVSPKLAILDNGRGMAEDALLAAMRPGSRSPLDDRPDGDLGRFGLGLKTASFSQCRKLTVVSRHAGEASAACWDLDYVAETDKWLVQIPSSTGEIPWIERLVGDGTLVLWEVLDRLAPTGGAGESVDLVRRIDLAREHLELVFHRFLSGEKGLSKIMIRLNGRPLRGLDPFGRSQAATIAGPVEHIGIGGEVVSLQSFTLPHHKKVSAAEWDRNGGRAGYIKNQGFYVYRAKRLIIHGTWFGLARQTELTKLARVRIDMPNGLDAAWKIDVKKASAQPPYQIRERLRRIIETIGATSRRVYTARGQRLVSDSRLPVWNRYQDKNEISYRVNREHPALAGFVAGLDERQGAAFARLMELIGATIPMESLFADLGSEPDKVTAGELSPEGLQQVVQSTVRALALSGVGRDEISDMLQVTEPFRSNWPASEAILALSETWNPADE